jgi:hypothetical protein
MMQEHFNYILFGLHLESEMQLPELIPSEEAPDVHVRFGEVPGELSEVQGRGVLFQAAPGKFLLRIPNIARFYITDGKEIVVAMEEGVDLREARPFLLGPAIGALLWQRETLVFHGSVIKFGDEAWIISGNSGAGKSSLAGAAFKAGLQVATDDTVALDINKGKAKAWPGYPYIKLWADVVEQLRLKATVSGPVRETMEKYYHPLGEQFCKDPLPITGLVWLSSHNTEETVLEEVKGMEKFNVLRQATHRLRYVQGLGVVPQHFKLLGQVAGDFRVLTVKRPHQPLDPEGLLEKLQNRLQQP